MCCVCCVVPVSFVVRCVCVVLCVVCVVCLGVGVRWLLLVDCGSSLFVVCCLLCFVVRTW